MAEHIRWSGFEFEYKEKTADWFWAVGIITVSLAAIAIIYSNALFGIFILIAGSMLLATARKAPRIVDYQLTEKGFLINDTVYPYEQFHTFWVSESKYSPPKLLFKTTRWTIPLLVITIETDYVDADTVRDYLLDYVPEERIDEPLSMKLMEFLGF